MDTRTFYDRISAVYDVLADAGEAACRNQGLRALQASPGERVLEIGFGTGHALAALAASVAPTGRAFGIDISPGMLRVARRTVAPASVGLALDDARALSFPNAVFDAVFMSFTLELFELADIPPVLGEIDRVLRPGGRLGVVAMAETPNPTRITDVYQWLHRHFPHFVDCRPILVTDLLDRAGFHATYQEHMSIWGLSVACVVASKPPVVPSPPR